MGEGMVDNPQNYSFRIMVKFRKRFGEA